MSIDRVERARRRQARRETRTRRAENRGDAVTGVDGLFEAGGKYRLERAEWVAVAKEDDRHAGEGVGDDPAERPIRLRPRGNGSESEK
ncbi:hypothetical protein FHR84_001957 [Actinopolyspora biskrensis]|uniref:Uncharacterized protein n=1 Tax=Actinopolyspora biskrensis TaxID=1470178 RepID=A0A852YY39_9ACTN|nr:hypothetical protein [Actinopolyspora biskrensis]NYH78632.1 hypothetical protein [Actinopolyspora biskrensis]